MNILKNILRWMGYDVKDQSMEAIRERYEEKKLQEEIDWAKRVRSTS